MTIEFLVRRDGATTKKVVTLWLGRPDTDGSVTVRASGDGGCNWALLTLCPDGTFFRQNSVSLDLGFKTDGKGRIVEKEW